MKNTLRPLLLVFVVLSLLCGLAYPLLVTALGRALFAKQAAGSLVVREGKPVGSLLIGQNFSDPGHFWGRPSATTTPTSTQPYNALASGGSNLGPLNPALRDAVRARVQALRHADPGNTEAVPVDLVTSSASGLDPHISVAAARYQLGRVAAARKLDAARIAPLIAQATEAPWLGLLGEPVVNVLRLNLALDALQP